MKLKKVFLLLLTFWSLSNADGNPEANYHFDQGNYYMSYNDYINARDSYIKAIYYDPDMSGAYYNLTIAYYNLDDYVNAFHYIRYAVAINPYDNNYKAYFDLFKDMYIDQASNYYNMGVLDLSNQNYRAAIADLNTALMLSYESSANTLYNLAIAYYNLSLQTQSTEYFQRAIECILEAKNLEPDNQIYYDYYNQIGRSPRD